MVYRVLINFNDKKNQPLHVADSEEEFRKTTVRELKEKFKETFSGVPDPENCWVMFGPMPLEDHLTLGFYKIKDLNVILVVMKMPGGGEVEEPPEGFPRSESMERLRFSM